ncbi:hypothetical protein PoB_000111500 [Plakobranchus ocellatus]|uniref:Uncharacterized protein n=1 Tax=Plakobranchus ocellatus TaxID=259542 RepID=A0AAV3XVH2_9GAST|nr:hypothetical protein PoB_000111500 [Plakobranchus ocellatus]
MERAKERLKQLEEELSSLDTELAALVQEKADLQQDETVTVKSDQRLSPSTLKHYEYILPLVKEIHLLELKIKEQKQAYEEKRWKAEAARLGQDLLAVTLTDENCVLKRWSKELSQQSDDGIELTNITYKVWQCDDCLKEQLGFTVLTQGVHVGLRVQTEVPCQRIHFLRPSAIRFGFSSETFIPGLEEQLKSSLSEGGSIASVVSLVAAHIQEDMAPYVIIVPMKKKTKQKKAKPSEQKPAGDTSENIPCADGSSEPQ